MRIFVPLLLAASPALFAQSTLTVPGCEAPPEIRQVLENKLGEKVTADMKNSDQEPLERQVLGDLIAKYPRELEPHRRFIRDIRWMDPEAYPAVVDTYVKQAEQHPDDPLALYLAATVLNGKDTPRAIKLLEGAKSKAPDFAWPDLTLAGIHASGKLADKKKAAVEVAAFFTACPSSTDGSAQWTLSRAGTPEMQAHVAAALRARLAKETDPKRLREYATLWGMEFRTHPPQEHDALRKQVASDLQRLESVNPSPDAGWLILLRDGYKQSGATAETVTAMEDRVIKAFPHSGEAYGIVYDRWKKIHKEPEDQKDVAAWKEYNAENYAALKTWMAQFTEDRGLQHMYWFYAVSNDPGISESEGLRAFNDYLAEVTDYNAPSSWNYLSAASFLAEHKWQPERAIELARVAQKWIAVGRAHGTNDNRTPDEAKEQQEQDTYVDQELAGIILRAAKLAAKPAEAESLKASIDGPPPTDAKMLSGYWLNRARLAALESRKADALTFYEQALFTRERAPQFYRGRLQDDLIEEARAVWNDTGGSEVAWNVWKTLPAGKTQELAEGRWEKATKTMPAFELADLSGKTWRLKNLEGKAVLINVWATWCGPCNMELPHLQKLYEKLKDRPDVQIVTFNFDEDLGLVAPFLKEKGFTFPVLPAYSFVLSVLDSVAIPQNWILDPKGAWRWSQLGYDASDSQWADTVIAKLQTVKTE